MHVAHYSHTRRNSNTDGFAIPEKRDGIREVPEGPNTYMSCSVPTLSRNFVARRTSEGETGRLKEELKCETCGKGYKHISSLAKHLWEHTPEWNVTKKLLISKHQQVQLLEAASILVGMNESPRNRTFSSSSPRNRESSELSSFSDYKYFKNNQRSHSVSQYPPSAHPDMSDMPVAGFVGGYFDVREPRTRQNSETVHSFDKPVFSPSPMLKSNSPKTQFEEEEEEGVLGKFE